MVLILNVGWGSEPLNSETEDGIVRCCASILNPSGKYTTAAYAWAGASNNKSSFICTTFLTPAIAADSTKLTW